MWSPRNVLLLLTWFVSHGVYSPVEGACMTSSITGVDVSSVTPIPNILDEIICKDQCEFDPDCWGYFYDLGSINCYMFDSKTVYKLPDGMNTITVLETCQYWNFAGWDHGCGFTYQADMSVAARTQYSASNRHSCWYQCLQYPRCMGMDWVTATSECYLYTERGFESIASIPGIEHYEIICPAEPYDSYLSGYHYYPMFHVGGGKLQSGDFTFIECQILCQGDASCQAVDWDVDKKKCWVHKVRPNGKDTSCDNPLVGSKNTYHIKKNACSPYPTALFTIP